MKTKGYFFWKKRWYSICSVHCDFDDNCNMCNTGHWVNVWLNFFENIIYKLFPNLWKWWVNKGNNKYKIINKLHKYNENINN